MHTHAQAFGNLTALMSLDNESPINIGLPRDIEMSLRRYSFVTKDEISWLVTVISDIKIFKSTPQHLHTPHIPFFAGTRDLLAARQHHVTLTPKTGHPGQSFFAQSYRQGWAFLREQKGIYRG